MNDDDGRPELRAWRERQARTLDDFRELVQLTQGFDALQMVPPLVEPQDIPIHLRHYAMTEVALTQSDKVIFAYARGTPQAMECFEMIRDFRGLSDDEFRTKPQLYTIVNTNSPRQIDVPMAQGLIDFARYGQPIIVTPFTLMGAMAPITVAGALTLSHAEALAAITLTQLARPGAPVTYGTFTSNVDMKSGAPAFGTPEQVKASLGAGQLARLIGLPWRCAAGSAANVADAQAAHETEISGWGAVLAGATVVIHAAGWLEGGLTVGYEKLITDMDMSTPLPSSALLPPRMRMPSGWMPCGRYSRVAISLVRNTRWTATRPSSGNRSAGTGPITAHGRTQAQMMRRNGPRRSGRNVWPRSLRQTTAQTGSAICRTLSRAVPPAAARPR